MGSSSRLDLPSKSWPGFEVVCCLAEINVVVWREAARSAQLAGTHAPIAACVTSAPSCWVAPLRPARVDPPRGRSTPEIHALQHGTQDGQSAGNPAATERAPLGSASDYFPLAGRRAGELKRLGC
jgi:hypothetical protein